jgi:hypothetical protein
MGRCLCTICMFLLGELMFAQTEAVTMLPAAPEKPAHNALTPPMAPMGSDVLKPTLGVGAGMFSFYGDLYPKKLFQHPSTSRVAYDLTLSQKLNDFLQVNFYVLFGKLGVNEDQLSRNANFESQINLGGVSIQYNFENLFPKRPHPIHPFVTLGFEGFEFLSKTDLYDQNGNKYYYWSDGSIKNLSETNTNASKAINLIRDYKYETDIRELNLDKFGKYPERAFGIPVGLGFVFHLSERVDLKLHTTMHFTTTDYIDGITGKSVGNRKGNDMNDKFMMTGFSLHWDLLGPKVQIDTLPTDWFNNVDFLALETADGDGDGVRDTADICPGTPPGAAVSSKGCPSDTDEDGVLDGNDKEPDSKPRAVVDEAGVTVSDSLIKKRYLQFIDTSNQYAEVITYFHGEYDKSNGVVADNQPLKTSDGTVVPSEYLVLLGTYKSGLSQATMAKFLSIHDIETTALPDSSIAYTVGHYKSFAQAQNRKKSSVKEGMNDAKVVYKKDGKFVEATGDIIDELTQKVPKTKGKNTKAGSGNITPIYLPDGTNKEDSILVANTKGVVYRVQMGAYTRRLSKTIFKSIDNLIEIHTEDDLYKYMSGSYTSFNDAAKAKTNILLKGYSGAFISAYKDGKRVSLSSVGATTTSAPATPKQKANKKKAVVEDLNTSEKPMNAVDKKLIVFKVQIGVFKNEPPAEKQTKYKSLKETVGQENTAIGLVRYTVGNTNNYNEAQKLRNKMQDAGLDDAFIIAFFNGQYITIQEALELTK